MEKFVWIAQSHNDSGIYQDNVYAYLSKESAEKKAKEIVESFRKAGADVHEGQDGMVAVIDNADESVTSVFVHQELLDD